MSLYRTILALVFISLVLGGYLFYFDKEYKKATKEFESFRKKSENYLKLKKKWVQKEEKDRVLKSIKARFKPSLYKKSSNSLLIEFKNLDERSFKIVGDIFLNSGFVIKKFDIKKDSKKLFFHIEVEI